MPSDQELLQEEFRDLQSITVRADHLRWVTTGPGAASFDLQVRRLIGSWREAAEGVAASLAARGWPPDGREEALRDANLPRWLPPGWLDLADARNRLARDLQSLLEWTSARRDATSETLLSDLYRSIEASLRSGLEVCAHDCESSTAAIDVVEESGLESLSASDAPPWWKGIPSALRRHSAARLSRTAVRSEMPR